MEPTSPVISSLPRKHRKNEMVLGAGETDAMPLAVYKYTSEEEKTCWVSRWRPTEEERQYIANGGDVYLMLHNRFQVPVDIFAQDVNVNDEGAPVVNVTEDPLEKLLEEKL